MESIIDRWTQMRRWERGLVFGNLCYFAFVACGLVFVPVFGITTETYMLPLACVYYGAWCVCGALLVQWLGEKVGMVTCFLLMFLFDFAIFLYYALSTFSISG
ncbi:MAG TPA: hypothetical protein VHP14_20840 [Anaerolineales bacterium]|nr:hypothetical protein [Anaerolineales bacterium]